MIRQVFAELGALPVCAGCGADYAPYRDGLLVMDHADGCSQAGAVAAQWNSLSLSRLSALS